MAKQGVVTTIGEGEMVIIVMEEKRTRVVGEGVVISGGRRNGV